MGFYDHGPAHLIKKKKTIILCEAFQCAKLCIGGNVKYVLLLPYFLTPSFITTVIVFEFSY